MIYQTLHTPPITPEESWRLQTWSNISVCYSGQEFLIKPVLLETLAILYEYFVFNQKKSTD